MKMLLTICLSTLVIFGLPYVSLIVSLFGRVTSAMAF
jgi:hypothetical protein